jgi:hypothetical protein
MSHSIPLNCAKIANQGYNVNPENACNYPSICNSQKGNFNSRKNIGTLPFFYKRIK